MALAELFIGVLTVIFGFAIIAFPKFIRFIIGGYFILTGFWAILWALI